MLSKTITFLCLFFSITLYAQDAHSPEMAESLRESGKIYAVVAVLAIVFIGLAVYLIIIDRKVSRLERERGKGSR